MAKLRTANNSYTTSILSSSSSFSMVEAYKKLRTNLMFALPGTACKKILVTSSVPDEGKSTVCANLGITLAQMSERILLIDCDLRSPSLHRLFKTKGLPGLSEVLAGMIPFEEAVIPLKLEGLHVLPAGTIPPNPAELLGSDAMGTLLQDLALQYDYILLDSPPLDAVSDAVVLTPKVNGTVVVVREGSTEHPQLQRALAALQFAEAKVLGLVLSDSKTLAKQGYGKYSKYGKYGYGNK